MAKKIAFIALIIAALICGIWGYFYLQQLKKPTTKPLDVLADNCYALLEVKEPRALVNQLTQGNLMWEEFFKITDVKKFNKTLLLVDSLTSQDEIKDCIGNEPLFIAIYGDEKKQDAVYAFNLSDINETEKVTTFFEKNFSATKQNGSVYKGVLNVENEKTNFFMFFESGLVVTSANEQLITDIAEKNNKNTLNLNANLNLTYKTATKDKGITLFIHFPYFYKQGWTKFLSPGSNTEFFTNETEKWIPADLGLEPSELSLRGFLPADSSISYKIFTDQDADDFKNLFARLPYYTSWFEAINISDYGKFVKDNYRSNIERRRADLKKYSDNLSADAQTEITTFIGGYACCFAATCTDTLYQYGVISISDEAKAIVFLKNTADSVFMNNDSTNFFYFSDEYLFKNICAGFFTKKFKYVSVIDECILFGNSINGINEYKKIKTGKNNFPSNERAISFLSENFNADLNYLVYADVFKTKEKLTSNLSDVLIRKLDQAPELYEKFDAVAFSLQKIKKTVFFTAHMGYNPKYKMYQNTLWETLVDTDLYKLPNQTINHKTNEKELVCQDMGNNLYLLSNTGKILWKKNVKEKILGEILQVDYFVNGKLQLLFVSENYIHLIDRNGNYLKDFPVKIKSGASGGISLFDYDNSKNYRLWIPLKNNTVCCLNTMCKAVDGFVPVNISAPLTTVIKQFVLREMDYFVLTDTLGNVYVTNRKGEERVKINSKLPTGNGHLYFELGKDISKTYIYYADVKTSTLFKLSLSDKLEKMPLKTEKNAEAYFFDTLQHGTSPLLVFVSENAFETFDFFGKKTVFEKTDRDLQARGKSINFINKVSYAALEKSSGILILSGKQSKSFNDNKIKLSDLPGTYNLIKGQPDYLVGFYQNKIFCIKQ